MTAPPPPSPTPPAKALPSLVIWQVLSASGVFFLAQALAKVLNFVFFLLLARWLSVEHFGILAYAITIALIVDVLADMGMNRLLLRDVSRRPAIAARRLALFLPLKAGLGIVLYVVAVAIVAGSHPAEPATWIFVIIGFTVIFTGATILLEQVLHSRGRFGFAAAAHLALALTQLGGTAAAHALGGGALAIAVMIVVGNVAYLAVILLGVRRCGVRVRLHLRPALWPRVLRQSAPFAAVGILVLVTLKVEFLVLGALLDATALGRFGGVARIFDAAMMLPLTLCVVFAPRFIQAQGRSVGALTQLYGQGVRLLLLVSVLLALLGIGLSRLLTEQLLPPEYAGTGDVLRVLFAGLPGLSLHLFNVALMLGTRTQTRPALLLAALVVLQVGVALVMVSARGEMGAAMAMVISSSLAAAVSAFAVRTWLMDAFILGRAMLAPLAGLGCSLIWVLALGGLDGPLAAAGAAVCYAAGAGLVIALQREAPARAGDPA